MPTSDRLTQVLHDWAEVFMHRSMRESRRFMAESGLSPSQAHALMRLYHHGHCGVSDLGDELGVTNAAASQLVDRMLQLGLITRREDASDRRIKQVALTSQGEALVRAGIDARRRWMEGLTDNLAPHEREAIIAALVLLTDAARRLEVRETGRPREHSEAHATTD
jgi:DNA-binding MarR family transcriptional regulator